MTRRCTRFRTREVGRFHTGGVKRVRLLDGTGASIWLEDRLCPVVVVVVVAVVGRGVIRPFHGIESSSSFLFSPWDISRFKTYYTIKECLFETGNVYVDMFQLILQYGVHIWSAFTGVYDAVHVSLQWRLCGRKGRRGRSGFDDSEIGRLPDSLVV